MDKLSATPILDTAVLRALNASRAEDVSLTQELDAELNQMVDSALADAPAQAIDEGESVLSSEAWQDGANLRLSSLSAPPIEPDLQQLVEFHSDVVSNTLKAA
jgi:hypothetical protein